MSHTAPVVFAVESDAAVRQALEASIHQAGMRVETFTSATAFLSHPPALSPSCLLLDIDLPALDGLLLLQRLADTRAEMPVICMTTCGDVSMTVRTMRAGAVDVVLKPHQPESLLGSIRHALQQSATTLGEEAALRELRKRYESLSRREREVMALVVSGLLNKQVGGELGISEITVKAHRGRMMRKMEARSLPSLVRMAERLQLARIGAPC